MRNLRRTLAAALLLPVVVPAVAGWAQTAGAAPPRGAKTTPRPIHVVQVTGPIDPVNADLVTSALARAARRKAEVVILALDSRGALDSNARRVWRAVAAAKVPVAVWVGPAGATARGAAAFVLQAATVAAVAPGTTAGPALPIDLDGSGRSERLAAELRTLAARHQRSEDVAEDLALHDLRLNATNLKKRGGVDLVEPTLGSLIVALDGRPIATAAGPKTLKTARVVTTKGGPRRAPIGPVSFVKLGLGPRLEHALVGPGVAWLFFVLGLCLIVFEFYAASVGVAGAVGALALVAALFGFSHLPVHIWAVALTAVAIAAFAVDVQAATTGIWTIFGTIGMFVGGIFFYGGTGDLDLAWWHVLLLTIGVVLFFVGGMASVVRARFSTPTLGRESMIGEMGEAHAAVAPDGIVLVRGAMWRARTNRATPIAPGDPIRVVAVDGVVLEVEPEVGGARDAHH